eukprot:CAMPEP_0197837656 /NCGR_PEP_ID=MMETSP1437-20131217/32799_1 /TAXON_ID=49252 ORGANISM="Eucampia antarctica, Strain CCMP1452" /NCGR_SAMPLE_ID=MMETSP1437 /ASSEMBLY_ACC=CAM_ASM_001096 /LENGTH=109 /DNA_ID=CAMNT_0043444857 /DNA_START=118 /DNA_END=443 /DNA_ORIENTATION=+
MTETEKPLAVHLKDEEEKPSIMEATETGKPLAVRLKDEEEKEKLSIMEARAGNNMIETIYRPDNQPMQIVYMTNKQAAAVAEDRTALVRMKEALCGKEDRSLIIDLVHS